MGRETRKKKPGKKNEGTVSFSPKKIRSLGLDNVFLAKTKGGSSLGYKNEYTAKNIKGSRSRYSLYTVVKFCL